MKSERILFSKQSDEWNTPLDLFRRLDDVFNFKLDPCADYNNSLAIYEHYDKEEDGLSKPWFNVSTFVNPPYSQIKKWVRKVLFEWTSRIDTAQYNGHNIAVEVQPIVMLVPARVDTRWWWEITENPFTSVVFIKGRLKFSGAPNSAPFPSCIIILSTSDRRYESILQYNCKPITCYKLNPQDD